MGDNPRRLAATFDGAYGRSPRFQAEMADAASKFRNFDVGSSLDDVASAPDYGNIDWSRVPTGAQAFGNAGGPDSYLSIVSGAAHNLIQDGKSFTGTPELELVHELLHPMQMMRDLAEARGNSNSEGQVQMREQRIAEELGYRTGETFPDVLGTGIPYQVVSPESDPLIHPMRYGAPTGAAPMFPGLQMAPGQGPLAPPIDDPLLEATRQLLPFFLQGLNPDGTSASPADGAVPCFLSSPTRRFGGGPMPDGSFAPPPFSGALPAGRPQTQVTPQRVSTPTPSMEDLIPEALKPLVPRLFPYGFNPDWSPASPPAGADASAVPSQATSRQASAPDPAVVDLLPPELRILVPFFFPQGFDNG